MSLSKYAGLLAYTLFFAAASQADGDYDLGKEKAQTCISCHGETGVSVSPQYPNLAGQYEDYLVQALVSYRDGGRDNAIMKGFAGTLSNDDIADLASYFSAQEGLFTPLEHQW